MIFIFIKGIMVSLQPTEEEKIKYEFIFSPDPMGLRKYIYIIFLVCGSSCLCMYVKVKLKEVIS